MKSRKVSVLKPSVAAIALAFANGAHAVDFEFGDGWKGNWSSSISLGSSWRASSRDHKLYGRANGALLGLNNGTGANTIDVGNLNYDKGDNFTTQVTLISEVEVKKDTMGAFLRGKAWYDYALENQDVRFGNQPNGYNNYDFGTNSLGSREPLSDEGFERLTRFSGTYLLDAYVYDTYRGLADNPLQVRVGNQVVNWGESLFIQGINQINPIDVPAFRKPGVQVKEVFLPVPIALANQSLGEFGSIEAFYQWKWRNTPIDAACGNYWAVAGGSISRHPGSCNSAVTLAGSEPFGINSGFFVPTIEGKKAGDSGEFGMAFRTSIEAIDTELGLYAMKIHSRTPIVSLKYGDYTSKGSLSPFAAFWEYPEDIKVYGLSLATNLMGWSVGAELGYSTGVPVQIDGNDLLLSGVAAGGLLVPGVSVPFGPYGRGAVAAAASSSGYQTGFKRTNKTQLQFNTIKVGNAILGAQQYLLVGEVGFQWNSLNLDDSLRYNRPFIFGPGPSASYGVPCSAINISKEGCKNDGYVTDFAWGYRAKFELTYTNVLESGIAFSPSVYWAQDVSGWSVDSQFAEGRKTLGLGAKFSYAKKYTLDLGAVRYADADYDPLRDRDYYSATLSVSF